MKLHALNERITQFGFPLEVEDNDASFHGHSRGILFAVTDTEGTVIRNHMPNGSDEDLKSLINDGTITKLSQHYFSNEEGGAVYDRIAYYVPYYVVGHSMFMPTLNYDNIIDDGVHTNDVDVELVLAHEGKNRYTVAHISTVNVPIISAIYESFETPMPVSFAESLGVKDTTKGEPTPTYVLDFYDEIGERTLVTYPSIESIRDDIISFRVIGLKWKVKEDD